MSSKDIWKYIPDILAFASLIFLFLYHLIIYRGRKKDKEEEYNLFFSLFVLSVALFILAPYFHSQYFLSAFKPSWLFVSNIEACLTWLMFYSGIKFLNRLMKFPAGKAKIFRFTYCTLPLAVAFTLTCNFINAGFYFKYMLAPVLAIVAINLAMVYIVYGKWVYRQKLFSQNLFRVIYPGFVLLTLNIFIYRGVELLNQPKVQFWNHYLSAAIIYVFAYALAVKFNTEYFELKDLKLSLEEKVLLRTGELNQAYELLLEKNVQIENQREEIIAINEQLSARASELAALDEAKSKFFASISHEFRTPLTLIIGPLEVLAYKANDEEIRSDYEMMLRQARRLAELINQLLELSKLEMGMMELKAEYGNFSRFIRSIVSSFKFLADERGVQLTLTEECEELRFPFDADKAEKIISNLLSNALKFTSAGGKVNITLNEQLDAGGIEIKVCDTGKGIEPSRLQYIFDPFYQADDDNTHGLEGSGIGLSLVKELVELHKGSIVCTSELKKGTAFNVYLPINNRHALTNIENLQLTIEDDSPNPQSNAGLLAPTKQSLILIAEDNEDMRRFIVSNLPGNYKIIETRNGADCFEKASELMPDLVISDVMMPVMDGFELTAKIKDDENTSHIPIILLTAKASQENKIEGLLNKADDYITKPFSIAELNARIENILASRKKLKEKFSRNITVNPSEITTTSLDEKFLREALRVVENNMDKSEFEAEDFCQQIGMSRAHVHRKLKSLTDQSATQFIRIIRLKRARQLIQQKSGSISEIAYQTGFSSLSYFSKCFKETHGLLPSEVSEM
jgi:signal transduction histidine kinase/DNA-binding response OmpR family regulator